TRVKGSRWIALGLGPAAALKGSWVSGLGAARVGLGPGFEAGRTWACRLVEEMDMTKAAPPSPHRPGRAVLEGLLDLRPSVRVERTAVAADDAVARGLAVAKVYAFASVDYPGAAQSLVFDSDG